MSRAIRLHRELSAIWSSGTGWQRLGAVNHSVLGLRFIVTSLVFFGIGGLLAMLIRAQLATSQSAFVGPELYNQIFTMHGTIMMFLFAIPLLEGLAVYLLPKMLGARDLAFPRLTAFGYWCYLFGGSILIASMLFGVAPQDGWFMYTPLSSNVFSPGINADVWLLGVTFVEISALTLAVELTVSILKMRAPGMSLDRMPIFGWYVLVTAVMMIVGFPPLIAGSILLEAERAFGLPFFDPTRGGDPLLWQHLFWLFGHPEVYIILLPAAGALSMIIPAFAGRPLIGYRAIVVAIVAMAFLSFGIWVHHMFTVGIPHLALAFFSAASALVAVPTAVQIFAWLATLAHGRPRWDIPMLYVFGFLFVFVAGGLTGVMLAMVPFNWQAHDTQFVVAHLHYVLVGGFVFPMLAGIYYWLPMATGRMPIHRLAVPGFWLIFLGFNATFLLMHLTGLLGMPRRVYTYPGHEGWEWLNLLSSVGGFVLTMGFALIVLDLIMALRFGARTPRNPWKAGSLEWAIPIPPTPYAFAALPSITERADRLPVARLGAELAAGRGYLAHARNNWQETLGVEMASGRPEQLVILPQRSYLPLVTALIVGGAVLSMLAQTYWLAAAFALGALAMFFIAGQNAGQMLDHGPLDVGEGLALPPHTEVEGSPPWWALIFALVADATILMSLVFGALYLWVVADNWPPPQIVTLAPAPVLVAALGSVLAPFLARAALGRLRAGRSFAPALAAALLAHGAGLVAVALLLGAIPDPQGHAHSATALILLAYLALHLGVGMLFTASALTRAHRGYVSAIRTLDLRLARLWSDYTAFATLLVLGLLLAFPTLVTMLEPVQ